VGICLRDELLERTQPDADSRQLAFAQLLGAARKNSPALFDKRAAVRRVRGARGDVAQGP